MSRYICKDYRLPLDDFSKVTSSLCASVFSVVEGLDLKADLCIALFELLFSSVSSSLIALPPKISHITREKA